MQTLEPAKQTKQTSWRFASFEIQNGRHPYVNSIGENKILDFRKTKTVKGFLSPRALKWAPTIGRSEKNYRNLRVLVSVPEARSTLMKYVLNSPKWPTYYSSTPDSAHPEKSKCVIITFGSDNCKIAVVIKRKLGKMKDLLYSGMSRV